MLRTIDLFAGAGGFGIAAAGTDAPVSLSVDVDELACKTLEANASTVGGGRVLCASVTNLSGQDLRQMAGVRQRDRLLVVGGAPCQPFSKAAYWVEDGADARYRRARAEGRRMARPAPPVVARCDPRRTLVDEFWRLVFESDADGFVFENVKSILHPRNRPVVETLLRRARRRGYAVRLVEGNALHYGLAQRRLRVFILGSRYGLPDEPCKTHKEFGASTDLLPTRQAGEAIDRFRSKRFFEPEEVVSGRWANHLADVPPGGNYKFHSAWAGHSAPTFIAETRFWNFLLKLHPEEASWTIAATPGPWTGPFHWSSRRLRTPELAALQGFPDGYVFAGSRRERVRQIGNAVPAAMAKAMIGPVLWTMTGGKRSAA